MRKIELHLDAALAIGLVFAVAVGFIAFQWHGQAGLAQQNIDLQLRVVMLELDQARLQALEKKCPAEKR